jgi:hypothetical protein
MNPNAQPTAAPSRGKVGRSVRQVALLSGCVALATLGAFALDRCVVEHRRHTRLSEYQPPDRLSIPAPDLSRWRPTPLAPGSAPPRFRLTDARTGTRVSLDDYRGRMPVVLLLSSFG